MAKKYDYDKLALAGLGIKTFLMEVKNRNEIINATREQDIQADYHVNDLAAALHPHIQFAVVSDIKEYKDARLFTLEPDPEAGTRSLAFFRAGQYVAVALHIGDTWTARPYSICSDPSEAVGTVNTRYRILVKKNDAGFAAPWIFENWKEGSKVMMSGPLGQFYYQDLRDARHVIAAAGGSGITPFMSMAEAIASGREHFKLTVLYGCRTEADILLKDRLDAACARAEGLVRVVYVLSEEEREGYAHGFISADMIRREAAGEDFSLFACGPQAMYAYLQTQADLLGLKKRRVRFEVSGGMKDITQHENFPKELAGREFRLTVLAKGVTYTGICRPEEPLLVSIEKMGIAAPSDCRSGECGWCHSRLISGETFIPEETDGRRAADKTYGWVHPCVTYPGSDISIEVFPLF